jgi:hypothetical protein
MSEKRLSLLATAGLVCLTLAAAAVRADEPPKVKIPEPGVPQIMTLEGRYIRAAYNNEGYAILGYRCVNQSVGEPWMLLEIGVALRDGVPDYDLTREGISLETPDGKTIPLPDVQTFRAANLAALEQRSKIQRDSINYFPPNAYKACRIGFFAELSQRALPWDKVELTNNRACLGRFFFEVPGGIQYGQYWLNVKFAKSLVRVPFRVFTKEENKTVEKHFNDIKKQVDAAFKPKPTAPAGK